MKIIKEKLESYEAPVPEGLWESVEASLFPQKTRKTRVLPWVWGLAAAAAVAAGVFIGIRLVDSSRDPIPQDDRIAVDGQASPDKTPSSSVDEGRGQSSAESAPIHLIPAPPRSAVAVAEDVPEIVPDVPVATVDQAEAANVTEVAEVAEAAEVAEISEVTEAAEVAEAKEDSEVTEVPEVAQDGFKTTHDGVDWSRLRSADDYRRGNHGPSAGISLSSAG
ncbi:MAG: hypothetical protein J6N54_12485, partial [Bacteroidales bacterium]|nr:hypothetical protein [Bacteroidales bacterium]